MPYHDQDRQLTAVRDRITQILSQSASGLSDEARASYRSSTGMTTFGEQLNELRAGRLKEMGALYEVLAGERKYRQDQHKMTLDKQKFGFEQTKFGLEHELNLDKQALEEVNSASTRGVNDATRMKAALETLMPDDADARARVARTISERGVPPDSDMMRITADIMGELGIEPQPKFDYKSRDVHVGGGLWQQEESFAGGRKGTFEDVGEPYQKREDKPGYRPLGPYVDENGNYMGEGVFVADTAEYMLHSGGQLIPMPSNAKPITETGLSRNLMTGDQFMKLAEETTETETALRQLERYWNTVKDSNEGWRLLADQYIGQLKTIFGGELNQKQLTTLIQAKQLQGLLGRMKLEVVGGGPMTETDALRVIMNLGGDVSALRNTDVVAYQIRNIMRDKADRYNNVLRPIYNAQVRGLPRGQGLMEKPAITFDYDAMFGPGSVRDSDQDLLNKLNEEVP